jgi:superoxide reductase
VKRFGEFFQTGDWKGEKHVPVIHAPEKVQRNDLFDVKMSIGDAINHPNTLEHHIVWFKIFFHGDGDKFPVELASFHFSAHGEGEYYTEPVGLTSVKLSKSGTFYAISYCNIHGVWENSQEITVE